MRSDAEQAQAVRIARLLLALSTILAAALVAVLAVEVVLELGDFSSTEPPTARSVRLKEHPPHVRVITRPSDANLPAADSLAVADYPLRIDRDGWIEPSRVHEKADFTVLFLGGSTTECRYVPERKRFVYLAGRRLERRLGRPVNALNGGVSGANAVHSAVTFLGKGVASKPDVAVLMHAINDLVILLYNRTYFNRHDTRSVLVSGAESGMALRARNAFRAVLPEIYGLVRTARSQWLARTGDGDEWTERRRSEAPVLLDGAAITGAFRSALETFCSTARAFGVEPVLMTQASRVTSEPDELVRRVYERGPGRFGVDYRVWLELYRSMNQTTREVAAAEGVALIDLAAEIPPTSRYLYDPVHFNDAGSVLAAEKIVPTLERVLRERRGVELSGATGDRRLASMRP